MPAPSAKRWTAEEARRLNEANPRWWPRYEVLIDLPSFFANL